MSVPTSSGSPVLIECFIMYRYDMENLQKLYKAWPVVSSFKRDLI